ncbi:hypothetical protein [Sphingomonas japonica]|uniref:Uncharacterized protein n=1 Tax=Sphingomonas japonica TaxID=511662 RepID=A0ABX0TWI5_9SPHN|nr:hypothetical protein [Sphingomonas japonica]NIJ22679.1 hypothetical protein [Sphingomonas japonica]
MLLLLTSAGMLAAAVTPWLPVQVQQRAQVRMHQRIVIRVPRLTAARTSMANAPLPPIRWVERDTDRCIAASSLAGAAVTRPDSVDLVLSGGRRLRANLGSACPALDFYNGFYLRPTSDGMVCARRDAFRSRSGGECRIEAFRALVPAR